MWCTNHTLRYTHRSLSPHFLLLFGQIWKLSKRTAWDELRSAGPSFGCLPAQKKASALEDELQKQSPLVCSFLNGLFQSKALTVGTALELTVQHLRECCFCPTSVSYALENKQMDVEHYMMVTTSSQHHHNSILVLWSEITHLYLCKLHEADPVVLSKRYTVIYVYNFKRFVKSFLRENWI